MSDTKDTGGPAFPNEGFNGWGKPQEGMTLRDYFAAKVIQGHFQNYGWGCEQDHYEDVARGAYRMADAMLKARAS